MTCVKHGRRQRGIVPPWIFIHSADFVDRGLVLFFIFFAIFRSFFFVVPPGNFSADALGVKYKNFLFIDYTFFYKNTFMRTRGSYPASAEEKSLKFSIEVVNETAAKCRTISKCILLHYSRTTPFLCCANKNKNFV